MFLYCSARHCVDECILVTYVRPAKPQKKVISQWPMTSGDLGILTPEHLTAKMAATTLRRKGNRHTRTITKWIIKLTPSMNRLF